MKDWHKYFIIFICLRILLWGIFDTNLNPSLILDGIEYKLNGMAFDTVFSTPWHYTNILERTPLYMIFIYVIQGNLMFQILFCGLAGTLAFKVNKWFGLYYLIYPNYVFMSFNFSKEALLISLTLIVIYFFRNKIFWLLLTTFIINLGFLSWSPDIWNYNLNHSFPFMQGIWEVWKPTPDVFLYATLGKTWAFILSFPFWLVIPLYFRKCSLDVSLLISIGVTLFFSFGWACGRYREIALPFIIFYLTQYLGNEKTTFNCLFNHRLKRLFAELR